MKLNRHRAERFCRSPKRETSTELLNGRKLMAMFPVLNALPRVHPHCDTPRVRKRHRLWRPRSHNGLYMHIHMYIYICVCMYLCWAAKVVARYRHHCRCRWRRRCRRSFSLRSPTMYHVPLRITKRGLAKRLCKWCLSTYILAFVVVFCFVWYLLL